MIRGFPNGVILEDVYKRQLYARPAEDHRRRVDLPAGAFLCGDSRVESTVENVWLDGVKAAREVLAYLAEL